MGSCKSKEPETDHYYSSDDSNNTGDRNERSPSQEEFEYMFSKKNDAPGFFENNSDDDYEGSEGEEEQEEEAPYDGPLPTLPEMWRSIPKGIRKKTKNWQIKEGVIYRSFLADHVGARMHKFKPALWSVKDAIEVMLEQGGLDISLVFQDESALLFKTGTYFEFEDFAIEEQDLPTESSATKEKSATEAKPKEMSVVEEITKETSATEATPKEKSPLEEITKENSTTEKITTDAVPADKGAVEKIPTDKVVIEKTNEISAEGIATQGN